MGIRTRFVLWTALMLGVAALFLFDVRGKLAIETDILALLPADERDPALDQAARGFSEVVSRKTLFLVGAPTAAAAKSAATGFAGLLRAPQVFRSVQLEVNASADATALYRAHRHGLLSDKHRAWLAEGQGQKLFDEALHAAYGLAGLVRPLPLQEDPFNLFGDYLFGQLAGLGAARPQDGTLMVSSGEMTYVLVTAESAQAAFSVEAQERLMPVIEFALAQTRALPGVEILSSGVILHASAASRRAQAEIGTVGTVSMIGVLLLVWLTFRSLLPLALSLASLGTGALAAMTACHYVFGSVHLVTLVFGSSLIGVAIDYSMHFLADQFRNPQPGGQRWTPREAVRHVGPGIAMGMTCGVLGYLALMLAPLPGLQQMAVFAAVGLAASCGCVLFWYPLLAKPMRRTDPPLTLRLAGVLDRALQRRSPALTRAALLMLAAFATAGLWRVQFIDDVRLLQSSPPELLENERAVLGILRNTPDSRFFVVRAETPQAVLEAEEQLGQRLDILIQNGVLSAYSAVSRALPSLARQAENRALLATTIYAEQGLMPGLLAELGFPPETGRQQLADFAAAPRGLSLEAWLASPISEALRPLWLGALPGGRGDLAFGGIVSLSDVKDAAALRAISAELPAAQLVDKVDQTSRLMTRYRQLAALLIAGAYLLIGLLLAWRYGLRATPKLLAVPVCAALLALSFFGWLGTPANLFNVLALFMVLGLGVDYAVFLREGRDARAATVLALTLTTLSTILAYGLLAFSSTPFIHSIGLTLLIGIGFTYLFALLSSPPANGLANSDNAGRSPRPAGTHLPQEM
jgi:predicted exporter